MPTLYVLQGPDKGKNFTTGSGRVVLGRACEDVPLSDTSISRRHAELIPEEGHWMLRDLRSSNGTYVNGLRVEHPTMMKHGDQIRVGNTLLVFGGEDLADTSAWVRDKVDLDAAGRFVDSAVLETVPSNEDSVILAAPETAEAVRAWRIMYQLTEAIGAIVSPQDLLQRVMDLLFAHMQVDRGFILMCEQGSNELLPMVARFRRDPKGNDKITTSRTIINHVIQRCEGVLCSNAMSDKRFGTEDVDDSIHRYGLTSVMCVPIMARRRIHGVIHIDSSISSHTYSIEQLRLATAIGHMTGMAIENAKLLQSRLQNERLAAVGETVAFLSHYIKNVLQGLRSGADVVEMGLKRDSMDSVTRGWRIVERGLDKIFHLTTNMLTFSKDREPNIVMAQLNTVAREAVELAQHQADERQVMLLTDFEDLPPAPVDPDGLHQVALNLINNAVDACEPEDGRVIVRTHFDGDSGHVVLTVEDNGAGIPAESLETIFQTFESTKGQGGTGLGLAAAKKIVDEHHGRIDVESRQGQGTAFHAYFPTNVRRSSDETHAGTTRAQSRPARKTRRRDRQDNASGPRPDAVPPPGRSSEVTSSGR